MTLSERLRDWFVDLLPDNSGAPKLDKGELEALLAELHGDRQGNRWLAAEALGRGNPGSKGVAALAEVLADPDPILSWEAGQALAEIYTPVARRALLEALSSGKASAQAAAATAFTTSPADHEPEVQAALIAALDNPEAAVRQGAAQALAAQPAAEALPKLLHLAEIDPDMLVRRTAALALGKLGNPAAQDVLEACRDDSSENPLVRKAAAQAISSLRAPETSSQLPIEEKPK